MIEQHAIEARGRALGLKLGRSSAEIRPRQKIRQWRHIEVEKLGEGDLVADWGVVHSKTVHDDGMVTVECGIPSLPTVRPEGHLVYAFTEI